MKLSDEIVLHLYQASRTNPMQYVPYSQLYSYINRSKGSVLENEFTAALRYLVGKRYIQEEAAYYRIISEGEEYAQYLLHPPVDYGKEAFHEQRRGNEVQEKNYIVALAALSVTFLLGCISILVPIIVNNSQSKNIQPQISPTSPQPVLNPIIIVATTTTTQALSPLTNNAPQMLQMSERKETSENGIIIYKDIYFIDPDGDAYVVAYKLISTSLNPNVITVKNDRITSTPDEQKKGAVVAGEWYCGIKYSNYSVILEARILDNAGNQSEPFVLDYKCP